MNEVEASVAKFIQIKVFCQPKPSTGAFSLQDVEEIYQASKEILQSGVGRELNEKEIN